LVPARVGVAEVVSGIAFAERWGGGEGAPLDLCSAALLRWKRIIKAYAAALYREDCSVPVAPLGAEAKRLELAYLRGFSAEQFASAADQILERSFSPETLSPLRERIARMHAAYRGVEEGDRYALTYRPGTGTELALNGEPLVSVEGADFAAAYFAIWLGPDPADEGLKRDLLEPRRR
ncbi:MAG TPA: chalcone isomerase family protein, partial [Myxococcota bacterium]|nr:chalcone isomerase family protein [Myxococcota bacterium]